MFRFEDKLENHMISIILSGHQERITTVDKRGVINSEFFYSKSLVYRSQFLYSLYDNIVDGDVILTRGRIGYGRDYYTVISDQFISWFYGTKDNPRYKDDIKLHQMLIGGREVIKNKIKEALLEQVTLEIISKKFKEEIDTIYEFANGRISWEMCAKIKRIQIIEYMTRVYSQGVYYPREHPAPSKEARGVRTMGDIALHIRELLRNPSQDFASIPFAPYGGTPKNELFQEFSLQLRLAQFSKQELSNIIPTLSYTAYLSYLSYFL